MITNFQKSQIPNPKSQTNSQFQMRKRGGYTLLFAILVMGIISLATITLASIVTRSLRTSRDLTDATVALYAAEAGNEEALYRVGQALSPCVDMSSIGDALVLSNGASFKRICTISATEILIRSTGSFGNAKMALQVKIPL